MSCIYMIENTANGKKYIGQSSRLKHRIYCHFNELKRGVHQNDHLQKSYNKYGLAAFNFKVLAENIPEKYIDDMERGLIATLRTTDGNYGYNRESGGTLQKRQSEQTKKKIGAANKGKLHNDEAKKRMSESHLVGFAKGRSHPMQGKKGVHHSPNTEFKKGMTPHNKGKKMPDDWINPASRKIIDSSGKIWPTLRDFCLENGGYSPNLIRSMKAGRPYRGHLVKYYEGPNV